MSTPPKVNSGKRKQGGQSTDDTPVKGSSGTMRGIEDDEHNLGTGQRKLFPCMSVSGRMWSSDDTAVSSSDSSMEKYFAPGGEGQKDQLWVEEVAKKYSRQGTKGGKEVKVKNAGSVAAVNFYEILSDNEEDSDPIPGESPVPSLFVLSDAA